MVVKKQIASLLTAAVIGCGVTGAKGQKLKEAINAIRFEQFEKAKLLLSSETSAEGHYLLGNVYYRQGSLDSASQQFSQVPSSSPFSLVGKALVLASEGDQNAARSQLSAASSQSGGDLFTGLEIAKAYFEIGGSPEQNAKQAIAVLNKISGNKAKSMDYALVSGDAYVYVNGGQAANSFTQASVIDPASPEPFEHLAALYRRAKNPKESLNNVSQGIAKNASYGPIYREEAETKRQMQQYAEAVSSYEKYLSLTDRSVASRVRYIQFLYYANSFEKANSELSDLKTKIKDFSKYPALYRLDAIADYELGYKAKDKTKLAAGLKSMEELFKQKSVVPLTVDYAYLGKLQSANGNDSLAAQTLEKAIARDSAGAETLYGPLIDAYLAKKNFKGVAAIYDKKLAQGDTSTVNYNYSAIYAYLSQSSAKSPDTAILRHADVNLAKVIQKQPSYYPAYAYRGYVNSLLDPSQKKGLATPYFQKIIDLSTSDPKFQELVQKDNKYKTYLLKAYEGLLYYNVQKKDMTTAKDIAQKVIALDSKNENANSILKQK